MRWGIFVVVATGCGLAEGPTDKAAVVRYDASGAAQVAQSFDGVHVDALAGHPSGGVVIAGSLHTGSSQASNPHTVNFGGVLLTPSADHLDAFVARLDGNGALQWVTQGAAGGDAHTVALAVAADGTIVAGGSFAKTLTFGGKSLNQDAQGFASAPYEPFVVALGPDGAVQWATNPIQGVGGGFVGGSVDRLVIDPAIPTLPSVVTGGVTVYPTGVVVGKLDLSSGSPLVAVPVKADMNDLDVGVTALAVDASGNTTVGGFDKSGGFVVQYPSLATLMSMMAQMGSNATIPPTWTKDPFAAMGRTDISALVPIENGATLVFGNADEGSTVGGTPSPKHSLFNAIADNTGNVTAINIFPDESGGAWFNVAGPESGLVATGISLAAWNIEGANMPPGPFIAGFDGHTFAVKWIKAPQLDESMNVAQGTMGALAVDKDGNPWVAASYQLSAQFDGLALK
jgi:hypothetical protein